MSLFKNKDGELRLGVLGLLVLAITLFGASFFIPEYSFIFSNSLVRSALLVIGIAVSIGILIKGLKKYDEGQDGSKIVSYLVVSLFLFGASVFGPVVGLRLDREASIPDVAIYWANGKVINATDSTKDNYYFKQIPLSGDDSVYVVKYGEEPGYNKTNSQVRNGDLEKSTAPRADEDWTRPATKEAQKFVNGDRSE